MLTLNNTADVKFDDRPKSKLDTQKFVVELVFRLRFVAPYHPPFLIALRDKLPNIVKGMCMGLTTASVPLNS